MPNQQEEFSQEENDLLNKCISILSRWVNKLLSKPESPEVYLHPIEEHWSPDRKARPIRFNRGTAGEVTSWNLSYQAANAQFLIHLDSLEKLAWIDQRFQSMIDITGFEDSNAIKRTHVISIARIVKLESGRRVSTFKGHWAADMQGREADVNRFAWDVAHKLGRDILSINDTSSEAWIKRIDNFPFGNVIEDLICVRHKPHLKEFKFNPKLLEEKNNA